MRTAGHHTERLWPSKGQGFPIDTDNMTRERGFVPLQVLEKLFDILATWYEGLSDPARFIFAISVVLSFAVTSYRSFRRTQQRNSAVRSVFLLTASVIGLYGLLVARNAPVTSRDQGDGNTFTPTIADPDAVDAQSVCPGYTASHVVETSGGITADLTLAGEACHAYGTDIADLRLIVEYQAADRLHVEILPKHIGPENSTWFIVPEELMAKPKAEGGSAALAGLEFSWSNDPSFSFSVTRKSTGDVLFDTKGTRLVFEDQFIEFASSLPENYNLYGLGETIHGFRLGNNLTRTLYAADVADIIDANLYGSHPIYLDTRYFEVGDSDAMTYAPHATNKTAQYKSYTHGVFQRSAHPQEVLLRESNITWRALGGTIDLYFYEGPLPDLVTKAYQTSAVGLPAMQQYWTFGFHQCRWGYNNWSEVQDVLDKHAENDIPLETIWSDIDYMKAYRNFENDPDRYSYSEGAEFLSRLHANNQHYVPIIDSGIYAPDAENASDSYPPFDRGVEQNAFILNPDGSLYIGEVWPGFCTFGDWIGALFGDGGANRWWISEVAEYHSKIAFDGIWIDMSEVSSFCTGSCGSANRSYIVDTLGTEDSSSSSRPALGAVSDTRDINSPPYTINNYKGTLGGNTISPNATHHDGTVQYDFHNVWGHQLLNATYHALLDIFPGKRPFIIGRSTFAGSGKLAGHWGGDNYSIWPYLYFSIPQALSFSLFGIPMFGVDTCGFADAATAELCGRWMQLSAFFPFYRNHNEINAPGQEAYAWGPDGSVAEASRGAMRIRYALLPYLYTLFARSHAAGETVMRALAWEFPDEPWLAGADRQFLLGPALLVTPCLVEGATTVDGVFPGTGGTGGTTDTVWYDWYTGFSAAAVAAITAPGQNVTLDAPLGHIPLHVRGGHVLPMQEPAMTTTAARGTPWSVLVALDGEGEAAGALYLDDGESVEPEESTWVYFSASPGRLTARPEGNYSADDNALGNVTVLGVVNNNNNNNNNKGPSSNVNVSRVALSGVELDAETWDFDPSGSGTLRVTRLDELTGGGAWKDAWELSWV
ncbi:glycoside hydrolase family 31 protein [Xylariaceae sp. FL0804]|nr:glycoside hydrolase family 31 protein [Xylariaceae sp. FL0804]